MFTRCLCALLACAPLAAAAHDFWLQPDTFRAAPNTALPFTLQVGHGPYRQRSPLPARRIRRFELRAADGATHDVRPNLQLGGDTADGALPPLARGTYLVVLETDDRAQSHLPALRFNDYLRAEGLTPALEERARSGRLQAEGSERYGRRAKLLLQIGDARTNAAPLMQPLGLTLEIVPDVDPHADPAPSALPLHVYYEGRPLAGALVKLTDLAHDAEPLETHVTDDAGRAVFALPPHGAWLLNVIWTKVLPAGAETDFETVFSSFSFGRD